MSGFGKAPTRTWLRDPPVPALVVEPEFRPRRVVVLQGPHANLPRLALPAVVPQVHEQLPALSKAVWIFAVVYDRAVAVARTAAQPVVH